MVTSKTIEIEELRKLIQGYYELLHPDKEIVRIDFIYGTGSSTLGGYDMNISPRARILKNIKIVFDEKGSEAVERD